MPEVSIIMPVYNKDKYLRNSIESVLKQTYQDYELIVINDGSTDGSSRIMKDYAAMDSRIHIINQDNSGVSCARNAGLSHASGKWIQFLDGDDQICPDYLETAVAYGNDNQLDIVFTSFVKIDENGKIIDSIQVKEEGIKKGSDLPDDFMKYQYENGFFGFPSNKIFKRCLIDQTNARFVAGLKLAEDLDFFVQLYYGVRNYAFIKCCSYKYLLTESNYSNEQNIDYFSQMKIQFRIRKWLMDSQKYEEYKEIINEKISGYAGIYIFDCSEKNRAINPAVKRLYDCAELKNILNEKNIDGAVGKIVFLLRKHWIFSLNVYLIMRKKVRMIYRMFKREKK